MTANVRDRARAYLNAVPALPQEIWSDRDSALFTRLTGISHARLVSAWTGGGKDKNLTTCNSFTCEYGKALGSGGGIFGSFLVADELKKLKKSHAWVPASNGTLPNYGDVFVNAKAFTHMGISLEIAGSNWNTVESGQGTVGKRDKICRKQRMFDRSELAGWVDIEKFFSTAAPIPEWLIGWWRVEWRNQDYFYHFHYDRQVRWTDRYPNLTSQPPSRPNDTGSLAVEGANGVTIRWSDTGTVEKFSRVFVTREPQMRGTWNGFEPLLAEKL